MLRQKFIDSANASHFFDLIIPVAEKSLDNKILHPLKSNTEEHQNI